MLISFSNINFCGKAHIHCKAGADRTGMYAFIYKMKNGIGNLSKNTAEWFEHGYHFKTIRNLWNGQFSLYENLKK